MAPSSLLTVRGLSVRYPGTAAPALTDLDLEIGAGECVAVVGRSGCGKSTLCRAILDLLPPGTERSGTIAWEGRELTADRRIWHELRGGEIGLVLQDHRHALDPLRRVLYQVAEVAGVHGTFGQPERQRKEARRWLAASRLPVSGDLEHRYPHQLSGGQRQRVSLAAALVGQPRLLLADEPTTALDLIVQRDIVRLLLERVRRDGLSLLLVTHDEELVRVVADRTVCLGARDDSPAVAVSVAATRRDGGRLEVRGLAVDVSAPRGRRRVIHGLDLDLAVGQAVGLVGESGAGKTTLARALAGWSSRAAGQIVMSDDAGQITVPRRRDIQLVSQDAAAALDPQQTVRGAVIEAARTVAPDRAAATARAQALLADVDLTEAQSRRRPGELSGGQRQRAQLARALAVSPRVLVADEPTSSLDPTSQSQILDLIVRIQQQHELALLIIAHDLCLLEKWCDEVVVMIAGHIVERYRSRRANAAHHPFARDLAAAAPNRLDRHELTRRTATGVDPAATEFPPVGCPYAHRCRLAKAACRTAMPPLENLGEGHLLRCPETGPETR